MSPVTRRIEVTELAKVYRKRRVVDGVSLSFEQGEIVGLLGPNGAGKSTTFYMIVGLIRPDSGKVLLDGTEVTRMPMYQRARRGIGYLAQEASVFRKLTVRENVLLVLEMTGFPRKDRAARADQLMEDLKITHRASARGAELSGGERRRVEIARALAANPSFLLLDEPFAGIDPRAIDDIQEMVQELKNRGLGVLITDHNAAATLNLTDRTYVIVDGKVVFEGTRDQVAQNEDVRRFYLGENFKL
ncbi:LPS export ABC transporter ATP-binding protein [Armatimonas rosea]|uniref:Lipopolysaccharide export system ATP-binding protein n=1 Tax=Armatimonas rosea TaxID=685828 RepID=A0A7W9W9G8_ARMRO|nr:LPS export ABC transporter ATP-binding protein [Armatimonas rosea]MBB6053190.1 lipopolysaccharide export system ATP-binding protein [Armatimonas rosea]